MSFDVFRGPGGVSGPRFADRSGRLYYEATPSMGRSADGSFIAPIDAWVLRWDPRTNAIDTMATLMRRDPKQPLVRPWRPFPATDASAALPDGRVVVVRAQEYRVEIWKDGKLEVRGPVLTVPRIPVTDAERNAFRDERARRPAGSGRATTPGGPPAREADRDAARRTVGVPDEAFPPALPPIVEHNATRVDPSGLVWVARSFRANDAHRTYDVFNDRAMLVKRVTIPGRSRVVGFGRNTVYVAARDADDLEWIERYTMPR
jgi:hypothetical protein